MRLSHDASPSSAFRERVFIRLAAASALLAAAILYGPIVAGLGRQWIEDADAAYGLVVAAAAVVAFAHRARRLTALRLCGSTWAIALLAVASILYVLGTLAADLFLVRLSLPAFLASAIWFTGGAAHLRALAAPLILCVVAIPLPNALVAEVTMPLQLTASRCAAALLALGGIPVVRDGNVLTLEYITLEVAQACSGMRSLVTLGALVAVYAALRELPVRRAATLALATVPIALAANGLRIAVTAILAARLGARATHGWVHDATGWVAFVLMCGALLAVQSRFRVRSESVQSEGTERLKLQGRAA